MKFIKTWFATSSPVVKMLMMVSITSMIVVGHRLYLAPYFRRQRYRAEEWANAVIEQEENMKNIKE